MYIFVTFFVTFHDIDRIFNIVKYCNVPVHDKGMWPKCQQIILFQTLSGESQFVNNQNISKYIKISKILIFDQFMGQNL